MFRTLRPRITFTALLALALGCGGTATDQSLSALEAELGEATQVEGAHRYLMNDEGSLVYVLVWAAPGTSGHDHVIRATNYEGEIELDSQAPEGCVLDLILNVEDFAVDEDVMRDHVGFGDSLSEMTRSSVRSNMLSEGQLDADRFPTMTFSATGCEATDSGGLRISGDLGLHGQSQAVSFETDLITTTEGLEATGQLRFRHSDFGITPYQFFGYENADEIDLLLEIRAHRVD